MARYFAFFTLFHLSLTFFRPEFPFKLTYDGLLKENEAKLLVLSFHITRQRS